MLSKTDVGPRTLEVGGRFSRTDVGSTIESVVVVVSDSPGTLGMLTPFEGMFTIVAVKVSSWPGVLTSVLDGSESEMPASMEIFDGNESIDVGEGSRSLGVLTTVLDSAENETPASMEVVDDMRLMEGVEGSGLLGVLASILNGADIVGPPDIVDELPASISMDEIDGISSIAGVEVCRTFVASVLGTAETAEKKPALVDEAELSRSSALLVSTDAVENAEETSFSAMDVGTKTSSLVVVVKPAG